MDRCIYAGHFLGRDAAMAVRAPCETMAYPFVPPKARTPREGGIEMATQRVGGVLLQLLLLVGWAGALRFDVSGHAPKCLSEEIHAKVLVLANYHVVSDDAAHHTVSVKVTSPYGKTLHNAEGMPAGQFGFTTSESGNYVACFWLPTSESSLVLSIELDWKIGVSAKDWESVARKDKIEGVELELMKLQGAVEAIHENLVYLREREREMRNVNEYTNTRVAWFGIISLLVCLSVAGWQLWHLKSYFERKKLI